MQVVQISLFNLKPNTDAFQKMVKGPDAVSQESVIGLRALMRRLCAQEQINTITRVTRPSNEDTFVIKINFTMYSKNTR